MREADDVVIRAADPADLQRMLELNNAAAPHVNPLDLATLRRLVGSAAATLVADTGGTIAGFIFAFGPGADYESENYRWFARDRDSFLYVDRVAVDPARRRASIGRRLYEAIERTAREEGARELTCEVNLRPPNPSSLRFHEALGFRPVGEQETEGGSKRVVLLAKLLRAPGRA